jgi:hypothetical protein
MLLSDMRFHARHIGVWGVFDGGVMGWRGTDLSENDAIQQAADLNVIFNQYGQREEADRLEVKPPIEVESATWSAAGTLDYWVKEEQAICARYRAAPALRLRHVCTSKVVSKEPKPAFLRSRIDGGRIAAHLAELITAHLAKVSEPA